MRFNYHKYRKQYAVIMLLAWLFLVALSIFHYHHIDIQEGNFRIETGSASTSSNPFDKEVDLTHECIIQVFAHSVLDYNFKTTFDFLGISSGQEFNYKEIVRSPSNPHYNGNPLRAPPPSV